MPRLLRLIVAGLVVAVPVRGQTTEPFALGTRVGTEVDAGERAYFGLFPGLDSPPPFRLVADGAVVRVLDVAGASHLEIPRSAADSLARLTETFEDHPQVIQNPYWTASRAWRSYIQAQVPVPWPAVTRRVQAQTGQGVYIGYVLYTTDSLLVLSPELAPRDASLPGAYALPRADVARLHRTTAHRWQAWGPLLGAGIGVLVGTAFSAVDGTALGAWAGHGAGVAASRLVGRGAASEAGDLSHLAFFDQRRPPELPAPDAAAALTRARPRPVAGPLPRRPRRHEWVSVGVQAIATFTEPEEHLLTQRVLVQETPDAYVASAVDVEREALVLPYRLDAAVRPLPWVRVGVAVGAFTDTYSDSVATAASEQRVVRRYGRTRPYAEAILPAIRVGPARIEASGGVVRAGYALRSVQTPPFNVRVDGRPVRAVQEPQDVSSEGDVWAPYLGVEVYSTARASVYLRHTWVPVPPLDVPEYVSRGQFEADLVLRRVEAHQVDGAHRELTIGARLHL